MYNIDILNQICSGTYKYQIDAYNAICVQQGGVGGHKYDIDALNELCGLVGASAGWKYNIDALNAIVVELGGTVSKYEDEALVQVASLLNSFTPVNDESVALFARMTTEPATPRKQLIDSTITSLKAAGFWAKLDALYLFAGHESETAVLNWIADSNNATLVDSPTFTTDRGINGNGTTSYINTNFDLSTDSSKYLQNSAHFGLGIQTGTVAVAKASGVDSTNNVIIYPCYAGLTRGIVNSTSGTMPRVFSGTTKGYKFGIRTASNVTAAFSNKSKMAGTLASGAAPSGNLLIGALSNGTTPTVFDTFQYSFASIGAGLSDAEYLSFITIIDTYLAGLGCGLLTGSDNVDFGAQSTINIDIISGQSNALAEYNNIADVPVGYTGKQDNILIWKDYYKAFEKMNAGVNSAGENYPDGTYSDNWGAEQRYLHLLQPVANTKIACIKSVMGGKKISEWVTTTGERWIELKKEIDDSIAYCTAKSLTPTFNSILWLQGESDIAGTTTAADYQTALTNLINSVRGFNAVTANIKWVLVKHAIGLTGLDDTKTADFNTALDNIAGSLSNILIVDTNSLTPTFADALHYTPTTILAIGQAWYDVLNP